MEDVDACVRSDREEPEFSRARAGPPVDNTPGAASCSSGDLAGGVGYGAPPSSAVPPAGELLEVCLGVGETEISESTASIPVGETRPVMAATSLLDAEAGSAAHDRSSTTSLGRPAVVVIKREEVVVVEGGGGIPLPGKLAGMGGAVRAGLLEKELGCATTTLPGSAAAVAATAAAAACTRKDGTGA